MAQYGNSSQQPSPPLRRYSPAAAGNNTAASQGGPQARPQRPNPRRRNWWRTQQQMFQPPSATPRQSPPPASDQRPARPASRSAGPQPASPQPGQRPRSPQPPPAQTSRRPPQPPQSLRPRPESRSPHPDRKVTPLRPQPPYRSPRAAAKSRRSWPPQSPSRPERAHAPSSPRRPRPAALPLLYVMRLLILGIGVAAIVGTVLSVLGPTEADTPTSGALTQAEPERSQSSSNPRANSGLSWNTELTYLTADLESLSALTPGLTQATFMVDLDTGNYVDVDGSTPVPAASTIKVPILVALLQAVDAGQVALDQGLVLQQQDLAAGSGELRNQPLGTQYPVLEVATQMIVNSDNTATNMIIELLGGATALNQQFRQWGLSATVIRSPLPDLGGSNTTSARDLVALLARVNQGELLSLRSRDRLLAIMQRTNNRSLIPSGLGDEAIVANKTGDIESLLGDVALVDTRSGKRYALAILVQRPDNDGRAGELIRRIAERVQQEMAQAAATIETTGPEDSSGPAQTDRFDGEAAPSRSPGNDADPSVPQG